jgi:hypothetical protein
MSEDVGREESSGAPAGRGGGTPWRLGLAGLVLMIAGYLATTYVPTTPRRAEQERMLSEVVTAARRGSADNPEDRSFAERLDRFAPPAWSNPLMFVGRLAFFGGLFLFVAAGLLMYRRPAHRVQWQEDAESDPLNRRGPAETDHAET